MPDLTDLDEDFADHLLRVAKRILSGDAVPVLGAGANLCDREGEGWVLGSNLPSGSELSQWLAKEFSYPRSAAAIAAVTDPAAQAAVKAALERAEISDLVRVSQYSDVMDGEAALYKKLREVFDVKYKIPSLHTFLAGLPEWMENNGQTVRSQLIVSTNYDDLVERALRDEGVKFDLLTYLTNGDHAGKFLHVPPDGQPFVIDDPSEYKEVDPDKQTVVLKIHGSIDRDNPGRDSYVITEDHYIEYLTRTEPSDLIPALVLAKMGHSALLFLGYGMRDWNLRVILHRILADRDTDWTSWAVQNEVKKLDRKIWERRQVELIKSELAVYITWLQVALDEVIKP